ncbi:MAG: energy transducer TonB [Syntrophobacterales bacterium]|nr:MAG: energy transducer TonB [Syntrophobacterales bacterium]
MERINANRNLIWGIALSLLVHGAFLGLPIPPRDQRSILPRNPTPLEISLVKVKSPEDAPPHEKPVPVTQPKRVKKSVKVRKKKTTIRREKSFAHRKEERVLAPAQEPPVPAPQGKITGNAPRPQEEMKQKATLTSPLPSVKKSGGGDDLKAPLFPQGEDPLRSPHIILARPRYDRNPRPPYPRIARRKGYQGLVVLKVEILPDGRVGELRVKMSSGYPILDRSALKTVRKWRFIPAKRGRDPIRIWAEIPIKFELE